VAVAALCGLAAKYDTLGCMEQSFHSTRLLSGLLGPLMNHYYYAAALGAFLGGREMETGLLDGLRFAAAARTKRPGNQHIVIHPLPSEPRIPSLPFPSPLYRLQPRPPSLLSPPPSQARLLLQTLLVATVAAEPLIVS
jgi:hypothetical protein